MAIQVDDAQRDALVERLFGAALGAYELLTVHLGDRLGYYRALAGADGLTSAGLAGRRGRTSATRASGSSSRRSPASSRSTMSPRRPESGATGFPRGTRRCWSTATRSRT